MNFLRLSSSLVLRGIYTCTRPELDWFYQFGVSEMFPDKYERFVAPIPEAERGDLLAAYHRRLTTGPREDRIAAARAWSLFEGETITLLPDPALAAHHDEDEFALAFARAIGEYGSVIFIAGNLPNVSEIAPLLIVIRLSEFRYADATAIAVVMLVASFLIIFLINRLQRWAQARIPVH